MITRGYLPVLFRLPVGRLSGQLDHPLVVLAAGRCHQQRDQLPRLLPPDLNHLHHPPIHRSNRLLPLVV